MVPGRLLWFFGIIFDGGRACVLGRVWWVEYRREGRARVCNVRKMYRLGQKFVE